MPGAIEALQSSLDYSSPAFRRAQRRIASMMVGRTVQAFRDQRRSWHEWPARGVPNIAGIITDLRTREKPQDHRFKSRPALIDAGTLSRSIVGEIEGRSIVFGSRMECATRMQRGEPTTIPVTSIVQRRLAKWLSKYPGKFYRAELGWLLQRHGKDSVKDGKPFAVTEVTIRPKPRPFIVFGPKDRSDALVILNDELQGEIRRGRAS